MKIFVLSLFAALSIMLISSCTTTRKVKLEKIELPRSVEVPKDGTTPIAGLEPFQNPARTITFKSYGDGAEVFTGEKVNFIYEGVDPTNSFLLYESTDLGYILTLAKLDEPLEIEFKRLCQTFIVSNPIATSVMVSDDLRYEQIIWTPRADGSWEVRCGTTNRGCKSEALDRLNKLRTKDYENNAKSTKMK